MKITCAGAMSVTNESTQGTKMKVYQAISAAMAEIAKEGIGKNRKNDQQGYKFRGIDDVYNALAPILSKCGLVMLPRVLGREVVERTTAKGNAIFYVTVDVEFDLVCAEDGSKHTVKTFGEAMDTADKATNKAMSAAYKYMAMEVFCIPTEGDNDADATTHEVKGKASPVRPNSAGEDFWNNAEGDEKEFLNKALSEVRDMINAQMDIGAAAKFYSLGDELEMAAVWAQLSKAEQKIIRANKPLPALEKAA